MAIKILKLTTGQELVADITYNNKLFTVVKPFVLQMVRDPKGESQDPQLALFPYAPYVKDHTVNVNEEYVVWCEELPQSMIRDYQTALVNLSISIKNHEDSDITDV